MKKYNFFIILLFVSTVVYTQEWREALSVAREAYRQKQYKKAYNYYQRVEKSAPQSIDLSQEIAQAAYKTKNYEQAQIIYYNNAENAKDSAQKATGYHNLGNVLMQQGKYKQAISAYKEAIKYNPNNDKTRHNLLEAMKENYKENKKNNSFSPNETTFTDKTKQNEQQKKSKLEEKTVEKKLDELTNLEIQTKQQMNRLNSNIKSTTIKKDW